MTTKGDPNVLGLLLLVTLMLPAAPFLRHDAGLPLATLVIAVGLMATAWVLFAWRTDRVRALAALLPNAVLGWFVITATLGLADFYTGESYLRMMTCLCVVVGLSLCVLQTTVIAHKGAPGHDAYGNVRLYLLVGIGPAPYLLLAHYLATGVIAPAAAFDPNTFLDGASTYRYALVSILPLMAGLLAAFDTSAEVILVCEKGR